MFVRDMGLDPFTWEPKRLDVPHPEKKSRETFTTEAQRNGEGEHLSF
jgi:hypothetical protein